tara:strand:- start:284 stop:406 length:123 start_codon:yes stop_codon:yes gene_type:complete
LVFKKWLKIRIKIFPYRTLRSVLGASGGFTTPLNYNKRRK